MAARGEWLTVGEAADEIGVDENTVRRYADDGRLNDPVPVRRLAGGHRRIHRDSVRQFIAGLAGPTPPDGAAPPAP